MSFAASNNRNGKMPSPQETEAMSIRKVQLSNFDPSLFKKRRLSSTFMLTIQTCE